MDKTKITIFGCGGHSRSVTDVVLLNDPSAEIVYVDDEAKIGEKLFGFDVKKQIPDGFSKFFIAIGDNYKRKAKFQELPEERIVSIISRKAHIGHIAAIGRGCFVGNFCHIGPKAVIGCNTIINTAAIVEHEVVVGQHCHIGPNATISGRCRIGDLTFIGVGATVKDYVSICSDVIIGAGATVVKNIEEPGTYLGTPAIRIK